MGALEAPQDKHGQEHRTSRAEQTDKGGHGGAGSSGGHGGAGSSGGHGGAGSSGGHGGVQGAQEEPWQCRELRRPWQVVLVAVAGPRSPRPGPYSRNPFKPPPQNFPGELGGIRSPPGLNRQDSTKQNRKDLQG